VVAAPRTLGTVERVSTFSAVRVDGPNPWVGVADNATASALEDALTARGAQVSVTPVRGSVNAASDLGAVAEAAAAALGTPDLSDVAPVALTRLSRTGAGRTAALVLLDEDPYEALSPGLRRDLGGLTYSEHLFALTRSGATHAVGLRPADLVRTGTELTESEVHDLVVKVATTAGAYHLADFASPAHAAHFISLAPVVELEHVPSPAELDLDEEALNPVLVRLTKALTKLAPSVEVEVTAVLEDVTVNASGTLERVRRDVTLHAAGDPETLRTALLVLLAGSGLLVAHLPGSRQSWTFEHGAPTPVGPSLRLKL
jgi:hypothetical protein